MCRSQTDVGQIVVLVVTSAGASEVSVTGLRCCRMLPLWCGGVVRGVRHARQGLGDRAS